MPFLDAPEPESLEALPHFPAEKPQEAPERPGALATTAAAMEEFWPTTRLAENVEGAFGPQISPAAQPGYNPVPDIPARHLEHAHDYLHLDNPAQVAAKTEELDHRAANMGIIARGGALGTAVAMAGGLLDPMNVATMALVPEAAPTRIGNAVRLGLANAAVTSGQELVSGALGQDTSMKGSLLNIGGSAVVGGVLGSLARRVPRETLRQLTDAASTDIHAPIDEPPVADGFVRYYHGGKPEGDIPLWVTASRADAEGWASRAEGMDLWYVDVPKDHPARGEGDLQNGIPYPSRVELPAELASKRVRMAAGPLPESSKVSGPIQRSVLEDAERQVMAETHGMEEAGFKGQIDPTPPEVPRRPPTYVPPKPEPAARPRPGFTPDIDPQRMSLSEAIAVTKGAESESHGLSIKEAEQQGLDPSELKSLRFGSRRVFTKGGASFDEMAQILHQHGYPVVDEAGSYSPNALLEALDSELRGQKQYSHHADDYLRALLEHERASEAADRIATGEAAPAAAPKAEGPLTEPPPDTSFDVEAFEKEQAEEAKASAELHALPGEPAYVNPESASTMGAAAVRGLTLDQLTTARGGQAYTKTIGKVAPGGRLMQSPFTKVRQLLLDLLNVPGTIEMHYQNIKSPDPIERNLWKDVEAMTAQSYSKLKEGFGDYVKRVESEGTQVLKRTDFEGKVAMAMRRGDKSDIPEVAKLAQWHRANIFEPWFKRAEAAGMLKGQETHALWAESYMTRLYDQQKIRANRSGWIETLRRGFISQGVDPAEATMIAHDVDRRIGGSERGTMDSRVLDGVVPKSGRVKERTLHMPDTVLEPFLSNDMRHLTGSYLRSMVPEVHMTERFGTRDLADQFQEIKDEAAHLIEQARAQGDDARMNELSATRDVNIRTLEAARDALYGNYGVPKDPGKWYIRAGRFLRQVNVSRMLGGATFKHFPDLANTIMRFGGGNTMEVMAKLATSLDAAKLTYSEAKRMGVATDMIMNVSSGALWDTASHSQFPEQRFMRSFNKFFTTITGETPLITGIQSLASKLAEEEILRSAGRVANARDRGVTDLAGALNKNRAAELAASGIDTGMLLRIAQQDKLSGQSVNGLRFGMSERWADKEAARALESAVERAAHGITMRPGIGDKPLLMNTEMGKFLLQFKSFEFAASRIVGLPMLQGLAHGDMRAAQGLIAQIAMATAGYVAYQKATGQKIEANPTKLLTELLERTNLMGWLGTAIFPGLHQFGFKDSARWYDKDPVSLLGPSAEMAADLYRSQLPARVSEMFGQAPGQQPLPFRRADMHFLRKMMPYNQVWYMRRALDNAEDWVGNQFNLPGKSLADYREEREREGNPLLQ